VRKAKHRNGEEFKVKAGIYQGLVLSLLLFLHVMEALTCQGRIAKRVVIFR